jgi:hypothetical protein
MKIVIDRSKMAWYKGASTNGGIMKNIIITALLVSNVFTAVILHSFTTGAVQVQSADYLTTLAKR